MQVEVKAEVIKIVDPIIDTYFDGEDYIETWPENVSYLVGLGAWDVDCIDWTIEPNYIELTVSHKDKESVLKAIKNLIGKWK